MIDKEILDAVIPVPDLDELKEQRIAELEREGFAITNFHSGGVFHTLMMIMLRVQVELLELARTILNQMFITHASGAWLDLKAADYAKKRKQAQKTQGLVTITRGESEVEAVKIPKGHVFKTARILTVKSCASLLWRRQYSRKGRSRSMSWSRLR